MKNNNALAFLATVASTLLATAEAQVICLDRPDYSDFCYNTGWNNACWDGYYGCWYCCNYYWYSTAWAIALWVILGLIIVSCLIFCCVAASREPRAVTYVDPEPQVMVVQTKKTTTTQPAPVVAASAPAPTTLTANQGQVVEGGQFTVGAPVQGQEMQDAGTVVMGTPVGEPPVEAAAAPVAEAPVAPATGGVYPAVNPVTSV